MTLTSEVAALRYRSEASVSRRTVRAKEKAGECVPFTELLKPAYLRAGIGIWAASFMGLLLVPSGIGHPWGFYFFAAVAVLAFLAVLTLPRTALNSREEPAPRLTRPGAQPPPSLRRRGPVPGSVPPRKGLAQADRGTLGSPAMTTHTDHRLGDPSAQGEC